MGAMLNRNYEKYSEPAPTAKCRPIKSKIAMAGILKPSTYEFLMCECVIFSLTNNNYKDILLEKSVDLLLVDRFLSWDDEKSDYRMEDILKLCRERAITAVFWDTGGDGAIYENIELIRQFDALFTIDFYEIDDYKKALNSENVFYLPFGVQPEMYNPTEKNIMSKEDDLLQNPHILLSRVGGTVNKIYSVSLKNNIKFVPKEIYEMLALGIPLISPYSKVLDELCHEKIRLYKTDDEYAGILQPLLRDKDMTDKLSVLGQRYAFTSNTYGSRIDTLLQTIGLREKLSELPGVTMITSTNKLDSMNNIFKNYENQNYKKKELIIILNNNRLNLGEWKDKASEHMNVKVFQVDESQPLGVCMNLAVDNSFFHFVSKCDDDNYYGPNFLTDLMNAFKYTECEIVGKLTYYCYLEGCRILAVMCPQMEYRYVNMLSGSAFIAKKEILEEIRFTGKPTGSDTVFLKECVKRGVRLYSADRFNYVYNRHASLHAHTWKMADEVFLRSCRVIDITDDYIDRISV
jgi:hypothetical protein